MTLPTLTLWQPWASLIAEGVKTIETRSWKAPDALIGQTIGIHAAHRVPTPGRGPMFVGEFHVAQGGTWLHGREIDARMPFGAIVATARLAACVLMVDLNDSYSEPCVWIWDADDAHGVTVAYDRYGLPNSCGNDITDQLPYGDFAPGRWAWMLDDIKPTTERCPCCTGSGVHPTASLDAGRFCPVCLGVGSCAPVPAKGRQKVWRWTP